MNVLDRLSALLKGLAPSQEAASGYSPEDPRVASAALMFHVIDADGIRREDEKARLNEVLSDAYGIDGAELRKLIEAGEQAEQQAIDLYAFTRVLKRALDHGQRCEFIEVMWEMVYADGERHELEDNIVWRVAELIGVDRKDRIALRQRVAARAERGDIELEGEDGA